MATQKNIQKKSNKKTSVKKRSRRSHVKMIKGKPHTYFKRTGRYSEFSTKAKGTMPGSLVGD